jgi:hypothetical protein
MIRSRMLELRRERAQAVAEAEGRSVTDPTPYPRAASSETGREDRGIIPRLISRKLLG